MTKEECWAEKEWWDRLDSYDSGWIVPIPEYWYDYAKWSDDHCFCQYCEGRYNPANHQEDPNEWYEIFGPENIHNPISVIVEKAS